MTVVVHVSVTGSHSDFQPRGSTPEPLCPKVRTNSAWKRKLDVFPKSNILEPGLSIQRVKQSLDGVVLSCVVRMMRAIPSRKVLMLANTNQIAPRTFRVGSVGEGRCVAPGIEFPERQHREARTSIQFLGLSDKPDWPHDHSNVPNHSVKLCRGGSKDA